MVTHKSYIRALEKAKDLLKPGVKFTCEGSEYTYTALGDPYMVRLKTRGGYLIYIAIEKDNTDLPTVDRKFILTGVNTVVGNINMLSNIKIISGT